jgi:hypothetical protein
VAETSNISKIAEILANDFFSRFLWNDTGGWNQNWICVRDDHALPNKKSRKAEGGKETADVSDDVLEDSSAIDGSGVHKIASHPSDVVFYYDEPYSVTRTYVNTDLKVIRRAR